MEIAIFIAGIATGMAIYKRIITVTLRAPRNACDYCEFQREKEKLFPRKE